MDTILTVTANDLGRLGPERAVDVFRRLLWAEATITGVAKNLIDVPTAITVADGGIDAEVGTAVPTGGHGIIKSGLTRYQVKSGQFSSGDASLRSLVLNNSGDIHSRVKSCLDRKGTFVVALFGYDSPDRDDDMEIRLVRILSEKSSTYGTAKVEVWRQNTLGGFLEEFPSLAMDVNGRGSAMFQSHKSWARNKDMSFQLVPSAAQLERVNGIRNELRQAGAVIHVRVMGEPGVGKTRVVLEATRNDDLSPLILYCDGPSKIRDGALMSELLRDDNNFHAIIVVDECPFDDAVYLWNRLSGCGPRIKLVTIYGDGQQASGGTRSFLSPYLLDSEVSQIIQTYGVDPQASDQWARLCGGFARVGHVVGQNLKLNPADLTRAPDFANVWSRFVIGGENLGESAIRERLLVLRTLSLFKRFGFSIQFQSHIDAVVDKIQKVDSSITPLRVHEIVNALRAKHILQGDFVLYVTPKLLQIQLIEEWWDRYGTAYEYNDFVNGLPEDLAQWHREIFEYTRRSSRMAGAVEQLLGKDGPFQDIHSLNSDGDSSFFFALSKASPRSALECLRRIIGGCKVDELRDLTMGRRYVVWALERMAIRRELFADAAQMLSVLAEAETESISNNASGVFADLFSPWIGRFAPTETPPLDRLAVLEDCMRSEKEPRIMLGLSACQVALETRGASRTVTDDFQDLIEPPDYWKPKVWGELFEYYEKVWNLLLSTADRVGNDTRHRIVEVLLGAMRDIGGIGSLSEMVQETMEGLIQKSLVERSEALKIVSRILHYDSAQMRPSVSARWGRIRDYLIGDTYSDKLRRYVAMDLLEDHYDSERNYADNAWEPLRELAKRALAEPALLVPEFNWLMTDTAVRAFQFGWHLGSIDNEVRLFATLKSHQKKLGENAALIGGYFQAMKERDAKVWEKEVILLANDSDLLRIMPEIAWRSGVTDGIAGQILELAETGKLDPTEFERFEYGRNIEGMSETAFHQWEEFLLAQGTTRTVASALALLHGFYLYPPPPKKLPKELTLRILMHSALFNIAEGTRLPTLTDDYWEWLSLEFVRQYPEESLPLATLMLRHFGDDHAVTAGFTPSSHRVLNDIAAIFPEEVWEMVTSNLGEVYNSKAFDIGDWLRGGQFHQAREGAIHYFKLTDVWKWVDKERESRSSFLGRFVPPTLAMIDNRVSVARELLIKYGDLDSVRSELHANFGTESFVGPGSLHYQAKREELIDLKKLETNLNVLKWLEEEISSLEYMIERERVQEESRGF